MVWGAIFLLSVLGFICNIEFLKCFCIFLILPGYTLFAGITAMTIGGLYLYNLNYKKILKHEIELRSSKMAIYPMLLAERDREYLKQLRRNRDAEAELMKNVPGWEVWKIF